MGKTQTKYCLQQIIIYVSIIILIISVIKDTIGFINGCARVFKVFMRLKEKDNKCPTGLVLRSGGKRCVRKCLQIISTKEHIANGPILCICVCSDVENYHLTYNQILYKKNN